MKATLASKTADARTLSPQQRWNHANPKATWAHRALASALKAGLIERQPCEECGAIHGEAGAVIHGHHDDYDRPMAVRWLCQLHHRRWHAACRSMRARTRESEKLCLR